MKVKLDLCGQFRWWCPFLRLIKYMESSFRVIAYILYSFDRHFVVITKINNNSCRNVQLSFMLTLNVYAIDPVVYGNQVMVTDVSSLAHCLLSWIMEPTSSLSSFSPSLLSSIEHHAMCSKLCRGRWPQFTWMIQLAIYQINIPLHSSLLLRGEGDIKWLLYVQYT